MQKYIQDATSGFLVFLIALPLCLGISVASGFPAIAGVLTAIVGGVMVSHIGSAPLTIKGPAAGLIVIALGAVNELGGGDMVIGYRRALAVGVVAAIVQIVFALFKAGRFASIMPPSVVHGMLAAIGVIIIAKQTPVMLGILGAHGEPLEMLAEIPHYIAHMNPEVAAIGALSVLFLVLMPMIPGIKKVPAPLAVLLATVPIAAYLHFSIEHEYVLGNHHYTLGPKLLVALPGSLLDAITFPDFSMIFTFTSMKYVAMFALVGMVESLLSVIAVDAMDPEHHVSDLNRDLLVTGIGNLVASMIGGLPMISEIVRSKANIDAGAQSQWSNFFHGVFLLLFVALLPGLLQMIPYAALAAMLVVTGARLASPKEFLHVWHIGKDQFFLFFVTFAVTLATDLLIGVGLGIALKIGLHVFRNKGFKGIFGSPATVSAHDHSLDVHVEGPLVFTNLLGLLGAMEGKVADGIDVVRLDLSEATMVDHTVQNRLKTMANEWPKARLEFVGMEALKPVTHDPLAFRSR